MPARQVTPIPEPEALREHCPAKLLIRLRCVETIHSMSSRGAISTLRSHQGVSAVVVHSLEPGSIIIRTTESSPE
jgi:hypothetical protein